MVLFNGRFVQLSTDGVWAAYMVFPSGVPHTQVRNLATQEVVLHAPGGRPFWIHPDTLIWSQGQPNDHVQIVGAEVGRWSVTPIWSGPGHNALVASGGHWATYNAATRMVRLDGGSTLVVSMGGIDAAAHWLIEVAPDSDGSRVTRWNMNTRAQQDAFLMPDDGRPTVSPWGTVALWTPSGTFDLTDNNRERTVLADRGRESVVHFSEAAGQRWWVTASQVGGGHLNVQDYDNPGAPLHIVPLEGSVGGIQSLSLNANGTALWGDETGQIGSEPFLPQQVTSTLSITMPDTNLDPTEVVVTIGTRRLTFRRV